MNENDLTNQLLAVIKELKSRTQKSSRLQTVERAEAAMGRGDASGAVAALASLEELATEEASRIGARSVVLAMREFKIATALEREHIHPWIQLGHKEYLEETDRLDGLVPERIWRKLERFGICLIRLSSFPAEATVINNIVNLIGFPSEEQNDYAGNTKEIAPEPKGRANSGNTTSELGFHVDGTQDPHQPAFLAFQYVSGAKLGANSRFADAAGILHKFDEETRYRILTTLARADAATFSKLGQTYTGPIFSFSETHALMCRVRFDAVISLAPECREAFALLQEQFEDVQNSSMFLPREGDVVVFDNWRIMHARDEIEGILQRRHRRVWIAMPRHEHQVDYRTGIRPVPDHIASQIRFANGTTA